MKQSHIIIDTSKRIGYLPATGWVYPANSIKIYLNKTATLKTLLKILPSKIGINYYLTLKFCRNNWICYYSILNVDAINKTYVECIGSSPEIAVKKMIKQFIKLGNHNSLNIKRKSI